MTFDTLIARLEAGLAFLPSWLVAFATFAVAIAVAIAVHGLLFRVVTRLAGRLDLFWRSLVARTHGPTRLAFVIVAGGAAASVAPLNPWQADLIRHALLVCFIALLGWVAHTALNIWTTVYLRRFKLDTEDNLLARKHVTQSRILRRVADALITVVTLAAVLMTFEDVRQYGVSLLASAGAAGIVVGLALQPVLKNLIAGIQLAVTQPIRIDDALLVEGEWGNVEEITSTYVVVRTWDWRRLILPLGHLIEKPFQNWTREGSRLIGSVLVYLDYDVPVDVVRRKARDIVEGSPLWDRDVFAVQVTDFKESTMEVRILMSASNAGRVFDLRCEVRERLIAFLRAEHPKALPRQRTELAGPVPEEVLARTAGRGDAAAFAPAPAG